MLLKRKPPVLRQSSMQDCPLCHGRGFTVLKTNDRYGMGVVTAGCDTCGLVQTHPRPDDAALAAFYAHSYRAYYQDVTTPSDDYIRTMNKDVRLDYTVAFLQRAATLRGTEPVLDIGCSEGAFFLALRRAGHAGALAGVEPNPEFRAFAARATGAAVWGALDAVEGEYGLVTLTHVFEHFPDPGAFLESIKAKLRPDGRLYIDVPDADAYASLADLHIAHLYHFTERTLRALLLAHRFDIVALERHAPPHHPKSIRLVAVQADGERPPPAVTSAATEAGTWRRVAGIRVHGYLLRRAWANSRLARLLARLRGGGGPGAP